MSALADPQNLATHDGICTKTRLLNKNKTLGWAFIDLILLDLSGSVYFSS